jgi:hypothetical protein
MANLHNVFMEYNNGVIRLSDAKRQELIAVRDGLRGRIMAGHFEHDKTAGSYDKLEFQSQGSFVTDLIINPIHRDYDLDDGVYLIGKRASDRRPTPEDYHKMVIAAIGGDYDGIEEVIDKQTCIRVGYKDGFHIDLPIYYAENMECPDLANRLLGWVMSNAVEFIAWFEEKAHSGFKKGFLTESTLFNEYERWITDIRKRDIQIRRLVRYFKSWGDLRREEMPCGLIMTILCVNNYYQHERDDIALKETLVLVEAALRKSFRCERPTSPVGEDLLRGYKNRDAFLRYLAQFIENAKQALLEADPQKACKSWQNSLGDRFPCHFAPAYHRPASVTASALAAGAAGSRPWHQ